MRFSIIVPIYKVEKYLNQCIDSILSQTFQDYEIILIDDGSPDKCGQICDKYAEENDKIKVIHKPNGGLSDARNVGIENSKGEYLIFIDSDDYICEENFLQDLYNITKDKDSDIIIYGYKKIFENNDKIIEKNKYESNGTKEDIGLMIKQNYFKACAWDKVIKRSLVKENNIKFPIEKYSEDIEWCAQLLRYANHEKIDILNKNIYAYRQRGNSITKTITDKNILDMISMIKEQYLNEKEEKSYIVNSFLAYEYAVTLGLIGTKKMKNIPEEVRNKVFNMKKLLSYNLSKKVKITNFVNKICGIKYTSKILGNFIDLKNN